MIKNLFFNNSAKDSTKKNFLIHIKSKDRKGLKKMSTKKRKDFDGVQNPPKRRKDDQVKKFPKK